MQRFRDSIFQLGDFSLQSGSLLLNAQLHFRQYGHLNAPKDNLVLLPTHYGGACMDNMPWLEMPGTPLDTSRYCVVIVGLLAGGESTSPSNADIQQRGNQFPAVTLFDNVQAQRQLLAGVFGDAHPALVMGWSMGGMQALQWACQFPDRVRSALAICATGRCSQHNQLFLNGVASALRCDQAFADGAYHYPPVEGLRAFARIYAGWAYCAEFFRMQRYTELGFASVADLLDYWEQDHLLQDANNLLVLLDTWKNGDISDNPLFMGDYARAMAAIRCPVIIAPSSSDMYFSPADAYQDALLCNAQYKPITSEFGHIAGGPGRIARHTAQVFDMARSLLTQTARREEFYDPGKKVLADPDRHTPV